MPSADWQLISRAQLSQRLYGGKGSQSPAGSGGMHSRHLHDGRGLRNEASSTSLPLVYIQSLREAKNHRNEAGMEALHIQDFCDTERCLGEARSMHAITGPEQQCFSGNSAGSRPKIGNQQRQVQEATQHFAKDTQELNATAAGNQHSNTKQSSSTWKGPQVLLFTRKILPAGKPLESMHGSTASGESPQEDLRFDARNLYTEITAQSYPVNTGVGCRDSRGILLGAVAELQARSLQEDGLRGFGRRHEGTQGGFDSEGNKAPIDDNRAQYASVEKFGQQQRGVEKLLMPSDKEPVSDLTTSLSTNIWQPPSTAYIQRALESSTSVPGKNEPRDTVKLARCATGTASADRRRSPSDGHGQHVVASSTASADKQASPSDAHGQHMDVLIADAADRMGTSFDAHGQRAMIKDSACPHEWEIARYNNQSQRPPTSSTLSPIQNELGPAVKGLLASVGSSENESIDHEVTPDGVRDQVSQRPTIDQHSDVDVAAAKGWQQKSADESVQQRNALLEHQNVALRELVAALQRTLDSRKKEIDMVSKKEQADIIHKKHQACACVIT